MTRGDLEGLTFFNRPIKPVALGITVLMVSITVFNLQHDGVFGSTLLATSVALLAFTSAVCLTAGWLGRLQQMAEIGLLLASITYVIRGSFLLLLLGPSEQGVWLSLGASVISGGSFLLERWDTHPSFRGK